MNSLEARVRSGEGGREGNGRYSLRRLEGTGVDSRGVRGWMR